MSDVDEVAAIARLEIENGLRQYDLAIDVIKTFLEPDRPFALRSSLIQQLQKVAVDGIEDYPGQWRSNAVGIEKSQHQPPAAHLIGFYVQEMCDYVNERQLA